MSLKSIVKRGVFSAVPLRIRRYYRGEATILMYHRLTDFKPREGEFCPNLPLAVSVDNFEDQLKFLAENYNCLAMDDFYHSFLERRVPENAVLITFDDGYRDNLELMLPLLEKYRIPATIFLTISSVEQQRLMWWYEVEGRIKVANELQFFRQGIDYKFPLASIHEKHLAYNKLNSMIKGSTPKERLEILKILAEEMPEMAASEAKPLTWEEVKKLSSSPLITVGAHTETHQNLSLCSDAELEKEISQAKTFLEDKIGKTLKYFSYPFGNRAHATQREFKAVEAAGFNLACTTRLGHVHKEHLTALTALPRMPIGYGDSMHSFKWKLDGAYATIFQKGRRVIVE
ncbi:MAG: polysaccharide deacetylase family protein [Bdellovibrionota bacterium]